MNFSNNCPTIKHTALTHYVCFPEKESSLILRLCFSQISSLGINKSTNFWFNLNFTHSLYSLSWMILHYECRRSLYLLGAKVNIMFSHCWSQDVVGLICFTPSFWCKFCSFRFLESIPNSERHFTGMLPILERWLVWKSISNQFPLLLL